MLARKSQPELAIQKTDPCSTSLITHALSGNRPITYAEKTHEFKRILDQIIEAKALNEGKTDRNEFQKLEQLVNDLANTVQKTEDTLMQNDNGERMHSISPR